MSLNDPSCPYESCMVEASAGTGKTYQLAKRFLYLVSAGSEPAEILCITFTKKAAAEMKARILSESVELLKDKGKKVSFTDEMLKFYESSQSKFQSFHPPKPLSPENTAKKILSSTQALKISTIDSLFYQWIHKFSSETKDNTVTEPSSRSRNLNQKLLTQFEVEALNKKSWQDLFRLQSENKDFISAIKSLLDFDKSKGVLDKKDRILEISKHNTSIYLNEKIQKTTLCLHENHGDTGYKVLGLEDFVNYLKPELKNIVSVSKQKDKWLDLIETGTVKDIFSSKLITKKYEISKLIIKGDKREEVRDQINQVEEAFRCYFNFQKKIKLNETACHLYFLFKKWLEVKQSLKSQEDLLEFEDLVQGSYHLFHNPDSYGVIWLVLKNIHHILLDEFQDTSQMQWMIFKEIIAELLSGGGDRDTNQVQASVFIVGDKKQSIYGFRDADPKVMDRAKEFLQHFEKKSIPLNSSYRTSDLILNFVTNLFQKHFDPLFPTHKTALIGKDQPFIPNCAGIFIHNLFREDKDCQITAMEKEASFLANYIAKECLAHPEKFPVYDKVRKCMRKIEPKDCCILYRNSTHVEVFEQFLNANNIPYKREEQRGFFDRQEIKDIISLLTFLVFPEDLTALISFLTSPVCRMDLEYLCEILSNCSNHKLSKASFFLNELEKEEKQLVFDLKHLLHISSGLPAHQVVCKIIADFQMYFSYENIYSSENSTTLVKKNLVRFIELTIEMEKKGSSNLFQCLESLYELKDADELAPESEETNAVSLMTIHKSKGLEFPFVFLVESSGSWYKMDRYWLKSDEGLHYIDSHINQPQKDLAFDSLLARSRKNLYQESLRLLYVALTRSSQYLMITGHKEEEACGDGFFQKMYQTLENLPSKLSDSLRSLTTKGNFKVEKNIENKVKIKPSISYNFSRNSVYPYETEILSPHKQSHVQQQLDAREWQSYLNPRVLSHIGSYMHRIFECLVKDQKVSRKNLWIKMVLSKPVCRRLFLPSGIWNEIFDHVDKECQETIESNNFRRLFFDSVETHTEMSIVDFLPGKMVRGNIDLFIRYKDDRILILDYKTGGSKKEILEDPLFYCQQQGFDRQLSVYKQAISSCFRSKNIETGVWLTKSALFQKLS